MLNLPIAETFHFQFSNHFAGAVTAFSGSTRVKVKFSLNSQNHPSETARRKRVSHHGHLRNMHQCAQDWAGSQAGYGKKDSSSEHACSVFLSSSLSCSLS
jgi:hypothetical protein